MKNLIAFCGLAGSGKTTAADYLDDAYDYKRISFATPIRDMLRAIGVSEYHLTDGKEEPCPELMGRTARHALQTLGCGWARDQIDTDFWVNISRSRIKAALAAGNRVVIDDCRFDNEADMIRAIGGTVVVLHRDGHVRKSTHVSEAGVGAAFVDRVISADDRLDLCIKLDQFLNPE